MISTRTITDSRCVKDYLEFRSRYRRHLRISRVNHGPLNLYVLHGALPVEAAMMSKPRHSIIR